MLHNLSAREIEVLQEMAVGMPDKITGKNLGISHNTVKVYARTLMMKTTLDTRIQVILWAVARGIIKNPFESRS